MVIDAGMGYAFRPGEAVRNYSPRPVKNGILGYRARLVDLVSGGTGLGLCPDGLGRCTTSAFTLVELILLLGVVLGILGAGIAGCLRFLRREPSGPPSLRSRR